MEERRKENTENWEAIKAFISGSERYREKDALLQKFQAEKLESLDTKVMIQNGRIGKLEKSQLETEIKIKQRKDNYATLQTVLTLIFTLVMAISAWITIFKK